MNSGAIYTECSKWAAAEIITWDYALSLEEIEAAEAYLASISSITLTGQPKPVPTPMPTAAHTYTPPTVTEENTDSEHSWDAEQAWWSNDLEAGNRLVGITCTFSLKDQDWGVVKAHVYLRLKNAAGISVAYLSLIHI